MTVDEMKKEYFDKIKNNEKEYIINLCKKLLKLGKFERHNGKLCFGGYGKKSLYIKNIEYNQKNKNFNINYFSKDLQHLQYHQYGNVGLDECGDAYIFNIKDEEIAHLFNTAQTKEEILNKNIKEFMFNENTKIELTTNENNNSLILLKQQDNREYFEIKIYDIKSISIEDFKVTITYYDVNQDNLLGFEKEMYDLTKLINLKEYINFLSKYL